MFRPLQTKSLTTTTTKCNTYSISSTNKQRITLFTHQSIVTQARAQAVVEQLTLTSLVERALLKYLPKETVIKKIDFREPVTRK